MVIGINPAPRYWNFAPMIGGQTWTRQDMAKELTEFSSVDVEIYGENGPPVQICVCPSSSSHTVSAEEVHSKVCEHLGLSEVSYSHFTLTQGVDKPLCRYSSTDEVTIPTKGLCLRQWAFNAENEKCLLEDQVALHLLYLNAKHRIQTGALNITSKQRSQLEELEKANFVQERQYVLTCQSLPLYYSSQFPGCTLRKQLPIIELVLGGACTLGLSKQGLYLSTGSGTYSAPWLRLKSWSACTHGKWITFAVTQDSGVTSLLSLSTSQTDYILAVINELIRQVQLDRDEIPHFHTDMIHRYTDHTEWDNALYEPDTKYPVMDFTMDMCTMTHFTPSP